MTYITIEREDPTFSNATATALAIYSRAAASVESKKATLQHKIFLRS